MRIWDTRPPRERVERQRKMLEAERSLRPIVRRLWKKHGTIGEVRAAIESDPDRDGFERAAD